MKSSLNWVSKYPFLAPLVLFVTLMVLGATAHPLWGDEAETAFFAKTILKTGLPMGFDGVNMSAVLEATVLNKELINHVTPPLHYYVMSLSFLLFGQSAFTARLPFILFGAGNLILFYYLCLKLTKRNKAVSTIAVTIYCLSVPLILFSQQGRYYSLTIFAGLLLSFSSLFLIERQKRLWPYIAFIFAGVVYVYSHYLTFTFFYSSLYIALITYLFSSKESLRAITLFTLKYLGLGMGIFSVFLPWYFTFKPSQDQRVLLMMDQLLNLRLEAFFALLSYLNFYNIFPYVFFLLLFLIIFYKKSRNEDLQVYYFLGVLLIAYSGILTIFDTVVNASNLVIFHVRYNLILMPFAILLAALIFYEIARFNKFLSGLIIMVYLFTSFLSFEGNRSLIWEYVMEITNPYQTSDQLVADYLEKNANDGDTAFMNYDRSHEPLIFLLGNKIKFVNRISPVNTRVYPSKNPTLPRYLYNYTDDPDWVILYSKYKQRNNAQYLLDIRDPNVLGRKAKLDLENDYNEVVLPVFFVSDIARPEIEWRSFERIEPTYEQQVFIYRKKQ